MSFVTVFTASAMSFAILGPLLMVAVLALYGAAIRREAEDAQQVDSTVGGTVGGPTGGRGEHRLHAVASRGRGYEGRRAA